MAKVTLNNGAVVDGLTLVRSNLKDYMERSKRALASIENWSNPIHPNNGVYADIVALQNIIYFISLDVADMPVRNYKQPK